MEKYFKAICESTLSELNTNDFTNNITNDENYYSILSGGANDSEHNAETAAEPVRNHKKKPGSLISLDANTSSIVLPKIDVNTTNFNKYIIKSDFNQMSINQNSTSTSTSDVSPIYAEEPSTILSFNPAPASTPYSTSTFITSSSPTLFPSSMPKMKQIPTPNFNANVSEYKNKNDLFINNKFIIDHYMGICRFNSDGSESYLNDQHDITLTAPSTSMHLTSNLSNNVSSFKQRQQFVFSRNSIKDEIVSDPNIKGYTLVTAFMEYGIHRLIPFLRQRRVAIMDLNKLYFDSAREYFLSLPDDYITFADHIEALQSIFYYNISKYYEPPMVMICMCDKQTFESEIIDTLVWLCDKNMSKFSWYHINYTFDALLNDVSIFNSVFQECNALKYLIDTFAYIYVVWSNQTDITTKITRKEMRKRLYNYKRWFVNPDDIEETISVFWHRKGLDESVTPELYFRFAFADDNNIINYLNIDVEDLDHVDDIYIKIKIY